MQYQKQYYLDNKERIRAGNTKWLANPDNYKRYRIAHDRNTIGIRKKLIIELGGKCSNPKCLVLGGCTDIRCLQIDHINGGGIKQFKLFRGTYNMHRYYLNDLEKAKKELQVLCANCNWIKRDENNECNRRLR